MTGSETYKALAGCPGFQTEFPMLYNYGTPVKPMTRPLIGREKQLRQLKAGLLRPELCNVLLLGEAGAGKALADTTPIPVADKRGYVPISELQYGDYVFDENGEPTKVIGVFPQGLKAAYRVTFDDGAEIVCNNEHLWNVHDKAHKPFETLTLDEMIARDTELLVPMNGAVQRKERNYHISPYAIGAILAAGRTRKSGPFCITTCDEFIAKKVAKEIGAAEAVRVDNMHHWYFIRTDMRTRSRYLSQQEVLGKLKDDILSEHRFIPLNYLLGSIEQRLELLRGLMDAAGTVINKNNTCECMFAIQDNKRLCEDVQTLVRSLGMRAELLSWKNRDDDVDYTVRIIATLDEKKEIVSLPRYKMRFDNAAEILSKPYPDLKIRKIEDLHTEVPMTCIYVEAKSHLFQAGREHIVTHNTALVQGAMAADQKRVYLEIDISKMIADLRDNNEMATKIKALFDEAARFVKSSGTEIVLFIDEFHLICMLSDAAVEALKPQLADSGTRGVRVIVATTFTEFREYISANQPLVQRLQRIEVLPPSKEATVSILKTFAKKYGVADEVHGTYLYEQIIDLSNRYIPANSQPRKSILLLDLMVGWYRAEPGTKMDINLLYDVLKYSEGIELNVSVDAVGIKKRLDSKVFAQYLATSAVASRLQITSADLNNKTKPMGSFLFTGSTGVGKGLLNDEIIPVWTKDGSVYQKRNGDLQIGDFVFNRKGEPVKVVGVYPRGKQDIYRVTFTDGREICTDGSHLWTYLMSKGKYSANTYTNSTKELFDRGVYTETTNGRHNLKYWIPMNEPVQYPEANLSVHPYVMGAFIGDGSLTVKCLTLSSSDEILVQHVAELLGGCSYTNTSSRNYNWIFPLFEKNGRAKYKQMEVVFADYPEVCGKLAVNKRIPSAYMHASVEQRWQLVKGLFDTDGTICGSDNGRYNVSYSTTSIDLANDIRTLLFSLGVASTIKISRTENNGHYTQYSVHVKSSNDDKDRFFWLPRKVAIAKKAKNIAANESKSHKKDYAWVGITNIEKLDEQKETTCIYVDDEEHLYQAGDYIVTHNTELTKQLAEILFADPKRLIRFDMTEYSQASSVERFRTEVTTKVWERPYSVLLFDEIEKACGDVTRILLQVLDDGRLIDQNNREVSFLNTYIVLTTNAASEIYETVGNYVNDSSMTEAEQIKALGKYMKVIRRAIVEGTGGGKFPPELLGRVDAICPFMPLSSETQRKILEKRMERLATEVEQKHGLKITYDTERVLKFILGDQLDTESDSGGARIVATKFEEGVVIEVARLVNMINSNTDELLTHDNVYGIFVTVDGDIAAENKQLLEGTASIVAYPVSKGNKIIQTGE